jgi:hypothetical protein
VAEQSGRRHQPGRIVIVGLAVAAVAATGTYLALTSSQSNAGAEVAPDAAALTTQAVERRDLTTTLTASCPVDYGAAVELMAGGAGTVTKLRSVGAVIGQGDTLYRLDDKPVVALRGKVTAWRDLVPWMAAGRDIAQAKKALAALGYADGQAIGTSTKWNWALSEAIGDFTEDLGYARRSTLSRSVFVFLADDIRVDSLAVVAGSPLTPGGPVLTWTGTAQRVTCSVDSSNRRYAVVGAPVDLTFPDLSGATGTVTAAEDAPGANPGEADQIELTVEAAAPALAAQADGALARAVFTDTLAQSVLAVPVTALVAFTDGGYGVQRVAADGVAEYLPVQTGTFADTWVEVAGAGLAEGDQVVVTP